MKIERETILTDVDYRQLYRALLVPRRIEEKMLRLIRQNRISKWFSGYGQEAIAVGCTLALNRDDIILPMHRNLGVFTTRGIPLRKLFCQLMGKTGGFTKGRDRTYHFGTLEYGIVGMISQLGAMLPVADGLALAMQLSGQSRVALSFIGEGATREGDFHEALSLAASWKLPVIFVVENNGYGLSTPTRDVIPVENLVDAAAGYGIDGKIVDGNDIFSVLNAVGRAAADARLGLGPQFLEMKTFRMRGHEEASGTKYVPRALTKEWADKDPVDRFMARFESESWFDEDERLKIEADIVAEIDDAVEFALGQPGVIGTLEKEKADVFAPSPAAPVVIDGPVEEMRFIDAISMGLRSAMQEDDRVIVMGQDIAEYGGVFKVTQGLMDEFGRDRVRNTPIIESGILGCALGMALEGYKPVVEIQYADFISCGFNQIVNNLATTHYRWDEPVNVTVRTPFGGYIGAGPFHSQSPEALFCHTPGIKVVIPSSPADAKGLLLTSIDDPNPVLFLEHKFLYRSVKDFAQTSPQRIPLGVPSIKNEGSELTIVTWGIGVHWAMEEVEFWSERGRSIEVIDLRTLVPMDWDTVLTSVKKTHRLLVLHEAQLTAGFGAEIVAYISEHGFNYLDAAPVRVAGQDMPIPFTEFLEKHVYSARHRLRDTIRHSLEY